MAWTYNDGGRKAAGFRGETGDCVTRAISIATGESYAVVYDVLNSLARDERRGSRKRGISSARLGVHRFTYERYLTALGWSFTATMRIGSGCKVHLRPEELPPGRIIASLSRHLCAVIDGVAHDTSDPCRGGTRCVYGYYSKG